MNDDSGLRRYLPAPRRRPTALDVLIRWRVEVLLVGGVVTLWVQAGTAVISSGVLAMAALSTFVPAARRALGRLLLAVVVPHRVRSGLVQAGVTDRDGRPPWILGARPMGDDVLVYIWLRSGTTGHDLRGAVPVLEAACGAARVEVGQPPLRLDRAVLAVRRPRWGLPRRW